MAISNSKLVIASFFLSLLVLHLARSDQTVNTRVEMQVGKIDCDRACGARCQLASRQRMCRRACGTCCARCNCVPPGTSGNHEACRCYATLTTHGGRRKCP